MDWTVELVASDTYVRVTTRGTFNAADHLRMTEDILTRPWWRPGTSVLFDHRQLNMAGATYSMMSEASDNHLRNDGRIGNGKAAIVMGSPAAFGSARQFQLLVNGRVGARLRIFLDVDAALAWLLGSEPT